MTVPWLTILWALPILGAVVILALPAAQRQFAKYAALAVSLAVLAVAVVLAVGFDPAGERFIVGQTVGREQPLGSATGPVHLGVRWNGEYIDPADFTDGPPRRARLVPVEGTPGRAAERRGACG